MPRCAVSFPLEPAEAEPRGFGCDRRRGRIHGINYVYAGMITGIDPGTYCALYLDEFGFSR